jgi:hypothetical protein
MLHNDQARNPTTKQERVPAKMVTGDKTCTAMQLASSIQQTWPSFG